MRTLFNFDFVVCGSGSSGSVIAGRIAENRDVEVLLIEAGGNDCSASVTEAASWMTNIGSERDWCFSAEPNPRLNGRRLHLAMGKGLGGGSSMNGMMWARGHRSDWDLLAVATGDPGWSYNSILKIYRRIEDWHGAPDRERRGVGGPVFVQAVPNPPLIALAFKDAAKSCGIPCYADANGEMMELERGCALLNVTVRGSRRVSIFRSYTGDVADKPNLTVLHDATVTRLLCRGKRVTGVEFSCDGETYTANAGLQVVVSLGAINTPKLLMQSGIGPDEELKRHGIPIVQHLPGVGQNFQDHFNVAGSLWEAKEPLPFGANGGGATAFWNGDTKVDAPNFQLIQALIPYVSDDARKIDLPRNTWSILPIVLQPESRGWIRLTGPNPSDGLEIDAGFLNEPADFKMALDCLAFSRAIGNSPALRGLSGPEALPGSLPSRELDNFIRSAIMPQWHPCGTAKMGNDALSVVDSHLQVYGIDGLMIADAAVLPRIPTGNTMAPCVVIGERASEILRAKHGI